VARGPVQLQPGDLVLMDEASMVANPDLADVIGQAAASCAKLILAGDTQQLQAVENGGGLSLLADALGFVQLAEPVRFRAAWEQAAGEPGRTLANGDLLRIQAVTAAALIVRRALDADPATGQRRWTDRTFLYQDFGDAELGYAVTDHAAQSRTVTAGLAMITGTEDRQHAYVVLSRGTDVNMAYVFTGSPKPADLVPGPRPAPELARYDRITAERTGEPTDATARPRPRSKC
jgi:hypothetical protein